MQGHKTRAPDPLKTSIKATSVIPNAGGPPSSVIDRALTPKEAAIYLGISVKTLANHRSGSGKGVPFIKGPGTRGSIRYALSELEHWRRSRTRRSTSDQGPGGVGS
jgi:Helix-turn-helix domain